MSTEEDNIETEENVETNTETKQKNNDNSGKNDKKEKKPGEKWEDKQKKKEKAIKEEIFPWGSDPCVKLRLAGGKAEEEERDISQPAGSKFPWYEKPVKKIEYLEKQEKQRQKAAKMEIEENKERFAETEKRFRKKLKEMSKRNRSKRIYESSSFYYRTKMPFEVMEMRKMAAKQRREKEREDEEEEEEEEEEEDQEEVEEGKKDDGSKGKKDGRRKAKKKSGARRNKKKAGEWPGSYPQPVFEDFLFFLKLMLQAESKTKESKKLALPPKKTPDNRKQVVEEFVSFLDVLLTANQMMRDKDGSGREAKENSHGDDGSEKDNTNPPSQISLEREEDTAIENTNPEQSATENGEEE